VTAPGSTSEELGLNQVEKFVDLIASAAMSQAMFAAAELGIADSLAESPKTVDELAHANGCAAQSLRRLLRALASIDICRERDDGSFELTLAGALLRRTAPNSMHSFAVWWGKHRWPVWGNLLHSVRTGEAAATLAGATVGMKQLHGDAEAAKVFHRAMAELTRVVAPGVVRACDFSGMKLIVDVGGGHGELLATILATHRALRGVLFDLPHAIEGARAHLESAGVIDRCDIVAGDFFSSVPRGGDAYLLKSVIHDWDDKPATLILRNCHTAAGPAGRLLLVEQIVPERLGSSLHQQRIAMRDLNMLVMLGGRERTDREFAALLQTAGFRLTKTVTATLDFSVIEALAA
jgi:hypothetical protein